jgi:uncharacterized membrane-anchored protein
MKLRTIILGAVVLLVLVTVNFSIIQKERLLARGETIYLEMAPADPRALIQGDYMALAYSLARELDKRNDLVPDGLIVIKVEANGLAHFARLYDGHSPLQADERLLRYRQRGGQVWLGPESFFFEEGQAEAYQAARYAELKLAPSGEVLLVDLRGPNLEELKRVAP